MDQQVGPGRRLDDEAAGAGIAGEDHLAPGVLERIADGTAEAVDRGEARDRDSGALVDRLGLVVRELMCDGLETAHRTNATDRGRIPGHRLEHVPNERAETQLRVLIAAAPDLDRVHSPDLGKAAQEAGDVADVIRVQVPEEDLRGGFQRQEHRREVRQGTRAQIEEEKSSSGFPTSINSEPEAWLRLMKGSPLPSTVTRISSSAERLDAGHVRVRVRVVAGVQPMGAVVSACVPPRCASAGQMLFADVDMGLLPVVGWREGARR